MNSSCSNKIIIDFNEFIYSICNSHTQSDASLSLTEEMLTGNWEKPTGQQL